MRRTLKHMNNAVDRTIDRDVTRFQAGTKDQVAETRKLLYRIMDDADMAIEQVARRSTPMTP